ncbi:type II toxin-antitoxin system RelE/ParE family toxin [Aquimarina sp. ERC-38]|uniref:type II toxin-antitoxin system RelE/ParE family toxin n=1 Tax=Aquimarina sp. ERC-38 TaxID=2949996 RepID=UPI002245B3AB|nr:type II toxin-antitoxin system RelE/ParE family toxin [Aquimarina sp. ERC-38]UZO81813.1 type II toxin-antitoxin system RelE/ParE family toxin [Aquimarina sp. ERC-38]
MGKRVIWTHQADKDLSELYLELLERSKSVKTTIRVMTEVFESSFILENNSEIFKLDPLKSNNDGTIRFYEKHSYRISYKIEREAVYVIRACLN